jgi:glutaredoxin
MKTRVTIYSRPECHLCHEAEEIISHAVCRDEFEIAVINIDEHPELLEQFKNDIPVVFINGIKAFKQRVDPKDFCRKIRRLSKNRWKFYTFNLGL